MKDLPAFRKVSRDFALSYIREVLTSPAQPDHSHLIELIAYQDGHYRALFDPAYFVLAEGRREPSRSQWNSLKKKLKRHHRGVFVFKTHGETTTRDGRRCYTIDFGFLAP